jgi:hypothetical protein
MSAKVVSISKGGPEELRAFYDHVRGEGVSHDGA